MTSDRSLPTGLFTVLITDIEGSTELAQVAAAEPYAEAVAKQIALLRPVIERKGYVKEIIGDSFFALFQHATDALDCAVALQQTLRDRPIHLLDRSGTEKTIRVRIAIYRAAVEVFIEPSTSEPIHLELNRAARFAAMKPFPGEQILVSEEARSRAANRDSYRWHPWPYRRIKDFDKPVNVYELLWDGGETRSEPGVRALPDGFEQEIKRYVPRPEQERIIGWLKPDSHGHRAARLVTLHGFGGMGKTRLAIECALSLTPWFEDGLYLVRLDDLKENPDKPRAILEAIGRAIQPDTPLNNPDEIHAVLRHKRCLMLLDNYESVQCDAVRDLLRDLLEKCHDLCLLVTGRVPVGLDGAEQEEHLGGMAWEQARELFVDRARRRRPDWTPTPAEEACIREITQVVSSIPLAIELTAAQIHPKTAMEVLESLKASPLGAMTHHRTGHGHSESSSRHESLEACIDWSFNLLTLEQQEAFAKLGLFADSFDVPDVEAVGGISDEMLLSLHEASLVESYADGSRSRYTFLPVLRRYAANRFAALPDAGDLRARYITHYRQLVIDNYDINDLKKSAVLGRERRNVLAAADHAEAAGDAISLISLAENLDKFLLLRGQWSECERLDRQALEAARRAGDRQAEGRALNYLGIVYQTQGRWQEAVGCLEQSLVICREISDRIGEGKALNNLGNVYREQRRLTEAIDYFQWSLGIRQDLEDRIGEGTVFGNLGIVYLMMGRCEEAIHYLEQSLVIWQEYKKWINKAKALTDLGNVYLEQRRWKDALSCYNQGLVICRDYNDRINEAKTLANIASLYMKQGKTKRALEWEQRALQVLETTEDRRAIEKVRDMIARWEIASQHRRPWWRPFGR